MVPPRAPSFVRWPGLNARLASRASKSPFGPQPSGRGQRGGASPIRVDTARSYVLTPEGIRVAVFYSKLQNRLLRPLLAAHQPPAPLEVRRALATLERAVNDYTQNARLGLATAA